MDLCFRIRLHLLTDAALVHQEFLGVVPMLVLSATTLCQFLESKLQKFEFKYRKNGAYSSEFYLAVYVLGF